MTWPAGDAEDIGQLPQQENASHSRTESRRNQPAMVYRYFILFFYKIIIIIFLIDRTVWSIWRSLLEETDKLAKAKLAAVEIFQTQIADDVKIVRQNKLQLAKKVNKTFT
jgi:hypothetical protein